MCKCSEPLVLTILSCFKNSALKNRVNENDTICPASPEQRRPSASSRTHSDGPVSQTLLTSTSKARAATRLRNPR